MEEHIKKPKMNIKVKSVAGIVALLVLFSCIVSVIGSNGFTSALMEQYSDGAFHTAATALIELDSDRIGAYLESGGVTQEYTEVWENLDMHCNSSGATFIYVIVPDTSDYGHITFIFSTINKNSKYLRYDFGYVRETTNDDYREKYRRLWEGESEQELVIRDKGYIETDAHITAMVPVKSSDGEVRAILCVQRQMDVLTRSRSSFLLKVVLTLIILSVGVIVVQSLHLDRVLIKPIKTITLEASRFADENVAPNETLSERIKNSDEIGMLASSIDRMEEQLESYIKNLTAITSEKERIVTELSVAARIQADILPTDFPPFPDRTEFDIYAVMDPAREVGGDFYNFFLIDDDHLCLMIADVSGKGVPAALFMMASMITLKNGAMLIKSPGDILSAANAAICSTNDEDMFVSVWLGILEISTGKLRAANAGHEYPVIKTPEGRFELLKDKHGLVIGAMDGIKYKEYELTLEPGSKLFVYTDGVPEATNAQKELFGTERMLSALNSEPDADPEGMLESVRKAVDCFVIGEEQFDDLTMLSLVYRGPAVQNGTALSALEVPARADMLDEVQDFIGGWLKRAGASVKCSMQISLAVEEVFINIASYAYGGGEGAAKIEVALSEEPHRIALTFSDSGIPFDPLKKEDPDTALPAEERDIGGLGVFLAKKSMDSVSYKYENGRNVLRLEKSL